MARYELDSAGIIMPAVADRFNSTFFRISVLLREEVDAERLQRAIDRLFPRFPHLFVCLVPVFTGYLMETLAAPPRVEADEGSPCMGSDVLRPGTPLVRIRVSGRRLAFEPSHIMTDGAGALVLLKALLGEYFALANPRLDAELTAAGIARPSDPVPLEEFEDAFSRYYQRGLPWPALPPRAWRVPGERLPQGEYRTTTFSLDLGAALSLARSRGYRMTEYLIALYLAALQDFHNAVSGENDRDHGVLSLMVPVDLRRFFPTRSVRNFSLLVIPGFDPRQGFLTFDVLAQRVQAVMRSDLEPKEISRQITRNVSGSRMLPLRLLPRRLKDPLLRFFYSHFGESLITAHLSNLGPVDLPPGLAAQIEDLDAFPGASGKTGTNAVVLSFAGKLRVNFGSVLARTDVEDLVARRLEGEGLRVDRTPLMTA